MPIDLTHLPRLPLTEVDAYVALEAALRDLRSVVHRPDFFDPRARAGNVADLANGCARVCQALVETNAGAALTDWQAATPAEHTAKDLLWIGWHAAEHLVSNVEATIGHAAWNDFDLTYRDRDGKCDRTRPSKALWHRIGLAVDVFATAVLVALKPGGLADIAPEAGMVCWDGKTILDVPLDQWRLLAALVEGPHLREKVSRNEVLKAVYSPHKDQPEDPGEALRKMIARANKTLRLGDIDLRVVAKGGWVYLRDMKRKTGRE